MKLQVSPEGHLPRRILSEKGENIRSLDQEPGNSGYSLIYEASGDGIYGFVFACPLPSPFRRRRRSKATRQTASQIRSPFHPGCVLSCLCCPSLSPDGCVTF